MEYRNFHVIDDEISSLVRNYKASHICLAIYALFLLTRIFTGAYFIAIIAAVFVLLAEKRNKYVRFSAAQCLSLAIFYLAISIILKIVTVLTLGIGFVVVGPIYVIVKILFAVFELLNLYFLYKKKCWRMPIVADIADKINQYLPNMER